MDFFQVDCVQYSVSLQSIESVNKEFKVKEDQPDKVLYFIYKIQYVRNIANRDDYIHNKDRNLANDYENNK